MKNFKIGQEYVTTNGDVVIYCGICEGSHIFHVINSEKMLCYECDRYSAEQSIISEYDYTNDEMYLAKSAEEWTNFVYDTNPLLKTVAIECAKIGYRKAKEELHCSKETLLKFTINWLNENLGKYIQVSEQQISADIKKCYGDFSEAIMNIA